MRILICDDEQVIIEKIREYLQEYFTVHDYEMPELVFFSDGDSLLADSGPKDIVFLDIEMPGPNGIFVGNKLLKRTPISLSSSQQPIYSIWMTPCVFRYSGI